MGDRIRKIYRKLYDVFIGDYDLWQQLLNISVVVATVGGTASVIISFVLDSSPIATGAYVICSLFAIFCMILSLKSKNNVFFAAVLFSAVINFILFPIMYFTSGGYHGGMPLWLLFGLVMTFVLIRKRLVRYIIYALSLVFQCGCILYSVAHPEVVIYFQTESDVAIDMVQSLVLVSLIIGIIFTYQSRAYEKKKQELDDANAVLSETNERITMQSMYTLAKTIDAKDKYTRGHSMRVAKYSGMLAERMGLPAEELEEITHMAMLHDIGKIGVPDAIINKPSRLTEDEYGIVKRHPVVGYEILSEMPEMGDIGIGARWHHERYDGKGYPDGLKGEEIPLPARIIGVADAYDAMTSNRSYRKYMTQKLVRQEIQNGIGTQFDPKVAELMLAIIDEDRGYMLRER